MAQRLAEQWRIARIAVALRRLVLQHRPGPRIAGPLDVRWLLLAGVCLAAAAAVHAVARSVPWTPPVHEKSVWTGVWTGEASGT
jgi:hypothetical protein